MSCLFYCWSSRNPATTNAHAELEQCSARCPHSGQLLRLFPICLPGLHMQLLPAPGPREAGCIHRSPLLLTAALGSPNVWRRAVARLPHAQLPHRMAHLQVQPLQACTPQESASMQTSSPEARRHSGRNARATAAPFKIPALEWLPE